MRRIPLFLFLLSVSPAFAVEQSILARVTVYWHSEGPQMQASSNGARLRSGHCAVDPKRIPYGSKVLFPDAVCLAVDSGPAVTSRKAARACGRNVLERAALVVDRFFPTKQQALAWEKAHPYFMTLRVVGPERRVKQLHNSIAKANVKPAISPWNLFSRPGPNPGDLALPLAN